MSNGEEYELTMFRDTAEKRGPAQRVRLLPPGRRTLVTLSNKLVRVYLPWLALGEAGFFAGNREQLFVGFQDDPRDGSRQRLLMHSWHGGNRLGCLCLGDSEGDAWGSAWADVSVRHRPLLSSTGWHGSLARRPA